MRLIVVCAAALGGVAVGDVSRLEPRGLLVGGLLASLGAALAWRRPAWRLLALATLAAALGGWRASIVAADDTTGLEQYLGLVVRVRAAVLQSPSTGPASVHTLVDVRGVGLAGRDPPPLTSSAAGAGSGVVRLHVVGDPTVFQAVATGEMLLLEGRLVQSDRPGAPTLLFPRLLEREPPPAMQPAVLLDGVRAAARAGIQRYLPEPEASLAAGVLLGGAGRLDADVRVQLQRSGLAHLVAIDGFKQVVVAGVLAGVAGRLAGARAAALPVLAGITGYTLLTGAHPAAVRAGLMVGLATLASLTGRVADPLTSVVVAATIMAGFEPRILLDVGLQLSLSATLGIVLLWPRLRPHLKGLPRAISEPAGLTLAVTVATMPVVLSAFQLVSLISPLAHVLAVPLLPVVLLSTALLALVSPISSLAAVVGWVAWLPSTLLLDIIALFGSLPGAALSTGRLPPVAAGGLSAALLVWGLWGLPEASALRLRLRSAPEFAGPWTPVGCLAACVAAAALLQLVRPDGRLHISRLAQARGEAVFIRGPTGRTVLVVRGRMDGAHLATQVADCLAVWEHRLDAVLPLDPDALAGLGPTLARYGPEQFVDDAADARVDLGGGAVLDVYASAAGQPAAGASIGYGRVWLPLVGHPPPAALDGLQTSTPPPAADLVSDGTAVWLAEAAPPGAQPPMLPWLR